MILNLGFFLGGEDYPYGSPILACKIHGSKNWGRSEAQNDSSNNIRVIHKKFYVFTQNIIFLNLLSLLTKEERTATQNWQKGSICGK